MPHRVAITLTFLLIASLAVVMEVVDYQTPAERITAQVADCALQAVEHGAEPADARRRCGDLLGAGQ